MKNSSKMLFFMVLMMGTMVAVTANSWLSVWMGLEINLLAFIPLMNDINNLKSAEASIKYFLAQALASSTLLFAVIMMLMNHDWTFQMESTTSGLTQMIIMSSLLMKSGTAPFHFWFTEVIEGLSWNNSLILMTWQKLAPLMIISYITMNQFLTIIIITTSIVGALGGMNMTSLRKLMAFSSINHLGWMIAAMSLKNNIWLIYFLFYSLLSATVIIMFNTFKIFHFNQMFSLTPPSPFYKISMLINLLSLGGLPPFSGFIPKWIVIQALSETNQMVLTTILIMSTLITLFFYLRLSFSATMINYSETNWNFKIINNKWNNMTMNLLSFVSTFGLIMTPLIYIML